MTATPTSIPSRCAPEAIARTRIRIVGMRCQKCVAGLQGALEALPGVRGVVVYFEHGDAEVDHDASISREQLFEAVEAAGYDAV